MTFAVVWLQVVTVHGIQHSKLSEGTFRIDTESNNIKLNTSGRNVPCQQCLVFLRLAPHLFQKLQSLRPIFAGSDCLIRKCPTTYQQLKKKIWKRVSSRASYLNIMLLHLSCLNLTIHEYIGTKLTKLKGWMIQRTPTQAKRLLQSKLHRVATTGWAMHGTNAVLFANDSLASAKQENKNCLRFHCSHTLLP